MTNQQSDTPRRKQWFKRAINPSILKLRCHKCETNQSQMLQYESIRRFRDSMNMFLPDVMEMEESGNLFRFTIDIAKIRKPSRWLLVKAIFSK